MVFVSLDHQLRVSLMEIPEIAGSGFSVREGLTGAGVTLLKGRTYFGSWRVTAGALVFVSAKMGEANYHASTADAAVRHTMLMILKDLRETYVRPLQARAG